MATSAELNAAMAEAKADPKVQAAAKAWADFKARTGVWNPGHGTQGPQMAFQRAVESHLPAGTLVVMGADGQPVIKNKGLPSWVYPLVIGGAMLGGGAALGAFSAPATAAEAATTLTGTGGAIPGVPGVVEAGAGATTPTIAGRTIGTGMATKVAAKLPNLAQGSGWVGKAIDTAMNAVPAIAGLASNKNTPGMSPEAQAMLAQQKARLEQANPLYEQLMRLSLSRLPTSAQAGLRVPTAAQAGASVPQVSGGNYAEDPATRDLLRQQLIRAQMADPVQQAVLRLAQARMPKGGG